MSQTYGQTDRQTTCRGITALCVALCGIYEALVKYLHELSVHFELWWYDSLLVGSLLSLLDANEQLLNGAWNYADQFIFSAHVERRSHCIRLSRTRLQRIHNTAESIVSNSTEIQAASMPTTPCVKKVAHYI